MNNFPEVPDLIYPEVPDLIYPGDKEHDETRRKVRPWDLFNKKIERATEDIQKSRMSICLGCPMFIKVTRQCKACGCFMDAKTKILDATCPLDKWDKEIIIPDTFDHKDH